MGFNNPQIVKRVRRTGANAVRPIETEHAVELLEEGGELEGLYINGLDLSGKSFFHKVTFRLCLIEDIAAIGTLFQGGVTFERCVFEGTILFGLTDKNSGMTCDGPFFVSWCEFNDNAYFGHSTFNGELQFYKCHFARKSGFRESEFQKISIFHKVIFCEKTSFREIRSLSPFRFGRCAFHDEAYFVKAKFSGPITFEEVRFKDFANFRDVQFNSGVSFCSCHGNNLYLEKDQIFGHLIPEKDSDYVEAAKEYHFFKEVFENQGMNEDGDECYYNFKKMKRISSSTGRNFWKRLVSFVEWIFLDIGAGYGTRPLRVGAVSIGIIFIFAVIYCLWGFISPDIVIVFEGRELREGIRHNIFDYIYFSLVTFTTMGFGDSHPNTYSLIKYLVAFESLCGIFFMTLFVGTFIRKIIR